MNLDGKRFGRLVVLGDASRAGYALCKCDCGRTKQIRKTSLTKANSPTRSCGCLHRESVQKIGHKTISSNSKAQICRNVQFNTNFQVITKTEPPKNNKSGCTGVWFNSSRNCFEAYIQVHGKRHFIGRFKTKDEAIKARKAAEDEFFKPLIEAASVFSD